MDINVMILYFVFPLSLLIKTKCAKKDREVLLYKKESSYLRGMASLMVVFAHYCLRLEEEGLALSLIMPFRFLGPLGVAFFLFLSGYGLYASNGIANLKSSFIKKRALAVFYPYLFIRIIYFLLFKNILYPHITSFKDVFVYVIGIVNGSWFVIVIMAIYIMYVIISFLHMTDSFKIGALFISTVCFSIILFMIKGYGASYWYGNNLLFPLGVLAAYKQDLLINIQKRHKIPLLCLSILLFILMAGLYFVFDGILLVMVKMMAGICLVALCLILYHFVDFNSPIMQWLGKYSLYIYLTHTPIYKVLHACMNLSKPPGIFLYFVLVILVPVICKKVFDSMVCFCKKAVSWCGR